MIQKVLVPGQLNIPYFRFNSVQFSCSVVSDSLRPHESQHARPPCPSPAPGVYPNPCALSRWCHPAIPYSVVPFSSCPQSFPASVSFPMSQLFFFFIFYIVVDFVIHWNETAMGLHVFPIPIPPPTSLSTRSL